jgi:RNA polymerase sigma-70 factor (ECF subfamily)
MSEPPLPEPQNSDEDFVRLLSRHEPVIRAFLRAQLPAAADVDVVMPEVALVAWRKFSELGEREAFARWACVIARYEVLRYRRDKARDRFLLDEDVLTKLADETVSDFSRRERQMAALEDCLQKLPAPRRSLVLGCYSPGASIKEVAARSGHSEDGLYQLLRRIRLELHRCVETSLREEATA